MILQKTDRIFLVFIVMFYPVDASLTERTFKRLKAEGAIIGEVAEKYSARSSLQCSDRCLSDALCIAYQFGGQGNHSCFIIYADDTQGQTLISDDQSLIYLKDFPDHCKSKPCLNGGVCTNSLESYNCSCLAGFNGVNCENNIDDCEGNDCNVGSTCVDGIDSYSCQCPQGFTGRYCESIDDCPTPNPCQSGGTCVDGVGSYTCECPVGLDGSYCETNIDDCVNIPCLNDGLCVDGIGSYSCECLAGYHGQNCETDTDECEGSPCLNAGTCVDGLNSYTCICNPGFNGSDCENNKNDCVNVSCLNGGTCIDGVDSYFCSCSPGFTGQHCETNTDHCEANPCENDGACIDGVDSYICNCILGFTGHNCENNLDNCETGPCQNGGICSDMVDSYICNCTFGFIGNNCEIYTGVCAQENPCQNNGSCIDGPDVYFCSCVPGFSGLHCQTNTDECLANPCQNNGTCVDQVNGYSCLCANNTGAVCELDCMVYWCSPDHWNAGDEPELYVNFETTELVGLRNGAQLTEGLVGSGGATDRAQSQWMEITGASVSCLTRVETCGPDGASLTAWIRLNDCADYGGIFSSQTIDPKSSGIRLSCNDGNIWYFVYDRAGFFMTWHPLPTGWSHMVLVFHGSDHGEGISVYQNGFMIGQDALKSPSTYELEPGTETMVIGRDRVNSFPNYASVVVDELTLWNRQLTEQEVQDIFNMY